MTLARDTASTVQAIIDLAAVFAADTNARNRRWSNGSYISMLNGAVKMLQTLATGEAPDAAFVSVDMTYDASVSQNLGNQTPAAVGLQPIAFVQDNRNSDTPITIPYVPPPDVEMERYRGYDSTTVRPRWTQRPGTTPDFRPRIALYPATVGNIPLLVWYVSPELEVSDVADTFPLSTKWTELVALSIAQRLLGSQRESLDPELSLLLQTWLREFQRHGRARQGPRKIPNRRKGIS